ncbi:MAG: hypothetical protein DRP74_03980 [Candidatus Omnitrophota bacterium]|nr:MAG: hypothetical protein DRP74_03980 [Candidatus Omnitrophota bacterium]
MKIDINRIPAEGFSLEEKMDSLGEDLATEVVALKGPLIIKAAASMITNAVTIDVYLSGKLKMKCSRCLNDFEIDLEKKLRFNYQANKSQPIIDLDPEIKQEVILDYPIKTLCRPDCKGLCPDCGENLNEGECKCRK